MQFFNDEDFSWRILAVEAVVIMLSVLLGFTLNGWRQSASEQETVEAAQRSIAAEVRRNKRQLEPRLPYYRTMSSTFDSLRAAKGGDAPVNPDTVQGWDSFRIPPMSSSSHQAVVASQALPNMEFEVANTISEAYALQDIFYGTVADKTLNAILNEELDKVDEYQSLLSNFDEVGQALNERYDDLLQTLAEQGIESAQNVPPDSTRAAR